MHPATVDRRAFLAAAPLAAAAIPAQAEDPKRIRVAVIGCGSVSRMYLPNLSKSPIVELVAVCDRRPERAERAAAAYKLAHHYPGLDALLAGVPFDLLVNLTDMQEHGGINRAALLAKRNVWSEKPLANTYVEARALLDLAKEQGVRLWGAPAVVVSPQFAFMAQALAQGKLGRVAAAHASYGHLGPDWSAFFYEKGGGSLPDLAVYNLATLTGLLGPAKSVTAMLSVVTPERTVSDKGSIRVEAEDNAMVLLDHGNGVISHVQSGFNYFDPHGHSGDGQRRPTITLTGSGGAMGLLGYDWAPNGVELATAAEPEPRVHAADRQGYVWECGASLAAESLATGKPLPITPEHALHVVEIIEAARASQETGRRIPLQSTFPWPIAL
jgi:predicted dehydrogenase